MQNCNTCDIKETKRNKKDASKNEYKEEKIESKKIVSDELKSAGDTFLITDEFKKDTTLENNLITQSQKVEQKSTFINYFLIEIGVLFLLIVIISYLIKYSLFRKTRIIFLLGTIVYLGFYKGGCPCMISSFEDSILIFFDNKIKFTSLIWFIGLIPLTYFFGKIWCGWLCHFGGLQEFLFGFSRFDILKTESSQKILKVIQICSFFLLVCQLIITKKMIFCEFDPFKVAFNLFSESKIGYFLLGLLLLSSVFVYRPFCRMFCPIGLILGFVSLIPFAKRVRKKEYCISCYACNKRCKQKALIYKDKKSILNVENCISCGECFGICKKDSLKFSRK